MRSRRRLALRLSPKVAIIFICLASLHGPFPVKSEHWTRGRVISGLNEQAFSPFFLHLFPPSSPPSAIHLPRIFSPPFPAAYAAMPVPDRPLGRSITQKASGKKALRSDSIFHLNDEQETVVS